MRPISPIDRRWPLALLVVFLASLGGGYTYGSFVDHESGTASIQAGEFDTTDDESTPTTTPPTTRSAPDTSTTNATASQNATTTTPS